MEPIDVLASLHRVAKDREGEITLTLKIPKNQARGVMEIEEERILRVRIEEETA